MYRNPYIVGLTGGIGSGKSTVAAAFRKLAIDVVDADQASRAVVDPGMPALKIIADRFGSHMICSDGNLNRTAMRKIIFSKMNEKEWLEKLLHPLIAEWIQDKLLSAKSKYVILESPILLETDQHNLVNTLLLIDIPEKLQRARAALRDKTTEKNIEAIINNQITREERRDKADYIFDNSGPKRNIGRNIRLFHEIFLKLAAKSETSC